MIIFNAILESHKTQEEAIDEAIDYANGIDWQEVETYNSDRYIYSDYVDTVNGVGIYYCYGADHFWFTDEVTG